MSCSVCEVVVGGERRGWLGGRESGGGEVWGGHAGPTLHLPHPPSDQPAHQPKAPTHNPRPLTPCGGWTCRCPRSPPPWRTTPPGPAEERSVCLQASKLRVDGERRGVGGRGREAAAHHHARALARAEQTRTPRARPSPPSQPASLLPATLTLLPATLPAAPRHAQPLPATLKMLPATLTLLPGTPTHTAQSSW